MPVKFSVQSNFRPKLFLPEYGPEKPLSQHIFHNNYHLFCWNLIQMKLQNLICAHFKCTLDQIAHLHTRYFVLAHPRSRWILPYSAVRTSTSESYYCKKGKLRNRMNFIERRKGNGKHIIRSLKNRLVLKMHTEIF